MSINGFDKLGIGPEYTPKLILDFCWNHEGSIGNVRKMLEALQREVPEESRKLLIAKFQMGRDLPWDRVHHKGIRSLCQDEFKIPYLCTAFDYKAVDTLVSMDVPVIKIGSAEAIDCDFVAYAARRKPLIISTGGMNRLEAQTAGRAAIAFGSGAVLMHCVSIYPSQADDLSLLELRQTASRGYSSHYPGILDATFALALGSQVIEKHYSLIPGTTDHPSAGTDHAVSIGPHHVATLCEQILLWQKMRGSSKSEETLAAEQALLEPFRKAHYERSKNYHQAHNHSQETALAGTSAGRDDRQQSQPRQSIIGDPS